MNIRFDIPRKQGAAPAVASTRLLTSLAPYLSRLRLGTVIGFAAIAGLANTPGPQLLGWQPPTLESAILLASNAAGTFNKSIEYAVYYIANWKYLSSLCPIS